MERMETKKEKPTLSSLQEHRWWIQVKCSRDTAVALGRYTQTHREQCPSSGTSLKWHNPPHCHIVTVLAAQTCGGSLSYLRRRCCGVSYRGTSWPKTLTFTAMPRGGHIRERHHQQRLPITVLQGAIYLMQRDGQKVNGVCWGPGKLFWLTEMTSCYQVPRRLGEHQRTALTHWRRW